MVLESLKDLSLDKMADMSLAEYAEKGMAAYDTVQRTLLALAEAESKDDLVNIKIGTVLTLAVLKKISTGKNPANFSKADWQEIAQTVGAYAIHMDGGAYNVFIFDLYAAYIRSSAEHFREKAPDEKVDAIVAIADELHEKAQQRKEGSLAEVAYTEDCLWLCLEAMIKLLFVMTFYLPLFKGLMDLQEITEAAATFAFEYGRFLLYRKEQVLVTAYLENQRRLDAELQAKFEAYKAELNEESQQFMALVDNAFDPQFRASLRASVELARAAGVREEEILKTIEDVDDFFMG